MGDGRHGDTRRDERECLTLNEDRGRRRHRDNRLRPLGSFRPLEQRETSQEEGRGGVTNVRRAEQRLGEQEPTPQEADGDYQADD